MDDKRIEQVLEGINAIQKNLTDVHSALGILSHRIEEQGAMIDNHDLEITKLNKLVDRRNPDYQEIDTNGSVVINIGRNGK